MRQPSRRDDLGYGRRRFLGASASLLATGGCSLVRGPTVEPLTGPVLAPEAELRRIAFGSCLDQDRPQPIWDAVQAYDPQLVLLLGDNVYANAEDEVTLREAYATLGRNEALRRLRAQVPLLATWDDHDFGRDDAGSEYPLREASQRIMLEFFDEPSDSPRRQRPGVYLARTFGPPGRRVQVLLLDTRYFRTELPRGPVRGSYPRREDPGDTILGEAQWAWLRERLLEPAELRLVASSVQLVADDHDYERWGVFPLERERLLALIGSTQARGVIALSGDRHHAELSRLSESAAGYPLLDLTSSSLNRPVSRTHEANRHRVDELVDIANFGSVDVDWDGGYVQLRIWDEHGVPRIDHAVSLARLQPAQSQ